MSGSKCTLLPMYRRQYSHAILPNRSAIQDSNKCKSLIEANIRSRLIEFINNTTLKQIHFKPEVMNGESVTVTKKGSGCTITSTGSLKSIPLENIYDLSRITLLIRKMVTRNTNIT
jgi:hypothetical protein